MTELTAEQDAAGKVSAAQPDRKPGLQLNSITREDIRDALRAGLDDFKRAPTFGLFFGAMFSIFGIVIAWALLVGQVGIWIFPVAAGFPLVGPFAAVVLYEVSRRLSNDEPLTWGATIGAALRRPGDQLLFYGLITVFVFMVWMVLARVIFAVSFGGASIPHMTSSISLFFTANGLTMLVIGTLVGAALAGLLFAISAIAVPLILDKPVDVVTAMITSVQAVLENRDAMGFWAAIIVGGIVVAALPLFIGMILVFPILGHASWHVYRRVVAAD